MRENLYRLLRKRSPLYAYYLYFDTKPSRADPLFLRRGIRVWFDGEYARADCPYLAVFCHVRKRDVPAFLSALEELKKSMQLCGHPRYEEEIGALMDDMERERSGDAS